MQATLLGQRSVPSSQGEHGSALPTVTTNGPRGIHSLYAWLPENRHNVQRLRAAARCGTPELLATTYGAASTASTSSSQRRTPQVFMARSEDRPRTRSFATARCPRVPTILAAKP